MNNGQFSNFAVVVTDASSAFGRSTALRLAGGGASLILGSQREPVLKELVPECQTAGGRAVAASTDVVRENSVGELADSALREFGRIDVWINNAGAGAIGLFPDVRPENHARVIETDLLGTIYGSYHALKQFRRQGSGILINVASVVGKVPAPYIASYVAAKYGVVGFSASLRQELREAKVDTIHVCTVLPAAFDTPLYELAPEGVRSPEPTYSVTAEANEVANAIAGLITDPRDEVSVGSSAKVSIIAHHLFPGLVESYIAKETHKGERSSPPGNDVV